MGINDFNKDKHMPMNTDSPHFRISTSVLRPELPAPDAIHYYGSIACMGFFVASNKYPILVQENPMDEGPSGFTQVECPMAIFDPTPGGL